MNYDVYGRFNIGNNLMTDDPQAIQPSRRIFL